MKQERGPVWTSAYPITEADESTICIFGPSQNLLEKRMRGEGKERGEKGREKEQWGGERRTLLPPLLLAYILP